MLSIETGPICCNSLDVLKTSHRIFLSRTCLYPSYFNYMISNPIFLLLLVTFVVGEEYPFGPTPFCSSKPIASILPLVIDEIVTVDMTNYFAGYNLTFTTQWNNFSSLQPKVSILSNRSSSYGIPIQMHLEHNGNKFGKDFVVT